VIPFVLAVVAVASLFLSRTRTGRYIYAIGGSPEAAKDVCMHIAAMCPEVLAKENLDSAAVEKERGILSEAARKEGKPENIIAKMVEGRLRNFFAERVLLEQPFVKDDKKTVGKFAADNGMKIVRFIHWELGR
jgi:elongation factor Ts